MISQNIKITFSKTEISLRSKEDDLPSFGQTRQERLEYTDQECRLLLSLRLSSVLIITTDS